MKKILLSLFGIITLGLNFGYCDYVSDFVDDILLFSGTLNYEDTNSSNPSLFDYGDNGAGTYCINFLSIVSSSNGTPPNSSTKFEFGFANSGSSPSNKYALYGDQIGNWICLYGNKPFLNFYSHYRYNFTYNIFKLSDLFNVSVCSNSSCSQLESDLSSCNSLLSGYSNSLDICSSNYNNCSTSLNSCLQSNCPDSENPLNSNSTVYIFRNNSYFPITGTNNIYVNLPSYIGYNFDYSNELSDLNISVDISQNSGFIEGVINEQSYIPTTEDFSNVFSNLGLFGSLLVVCLFVILVFYMIKKVFN